MLSAWFLEANRVAPFNSGSQRFPPALSLFGLIVGAALPYLIVKKEDSGHGFAYFFAYIMLLVFLWIDVDTITRWLLTPR